jgi:hypothetical protein
VITDSNEVLALGRDDTIGRVFDSVTGTAVLIDTTLNTDVVRVHFGLEWTVTTIGQVDDDKSRANKKDSVGYTATLFFYFLNNSLLCAFFNQRTKVFTTIGCMGSRTQRNGDGSQDGTLATAIVANHKIDLGSKVNLEIFVTHEIVKFDSGDGTAISHFL